MTRKKRNGKNSIQNRSIEKKIDYVESLLKDLDIPYYRTIPALNTISDPTANTQSNLGMMRFATSSDEAREIEKQLKKSAARGKPFIDGPKKIRTHAILEQIETTYLKLRKELHREPTTTELWHAIPINNIIQEKDEDTMTISHRNPKNEIIEREMKFKTFQNRLSIIKKKYSSK
jgi:nitrogenase subunit NifH